jgi:hypothetical protein
MWLWLRLLVALLAFAIGLKPGPWRIEPRDEEGEAWPACEALEELHWQVAEAPLPTPRVHGAPVGASRDQAGLRTRHAQDVGVGAPTPEARQPVVLRDQAGM